MVNVYVSAFIRHGEPPTVLLIQNCRQGRIHAVLPGGKMQEGETVEHALMRGVREESGLGVVLNDLLFVTDAFDPINARVRLNLVFSAAIVGGELRSASRGTPPSEQGSGAYFVPLRSLESQNLYPPIAAHLLGACGGGFREGGRYLVNDGKDVGSETDSVISDDRERDEKETA